MADEQNKQNGEAQPSKEVMGVGAHEVTYDMSVAGKPKDTVWDDMVNALHPKYGKQKGK